MVNVNALSGRGGTYDDGGKQVQEKKDEQKLIFSFYDKSENGIVEADEMGIEAKLTKISEDLSECARAHTNFGAGMLKNIDSMINKLKEGISYDIQDQQSYDDITKEVAARKKDVDTLAKFVESFSNKSSEAEDEAIKDFQRTGFISNAAIDVLGPEHNKNLIEKYEEDLLMEQLDSALDGLVKGYKEKSKDGNAINHEDLIIQTLRGLGFVKVDVSPLYYGTEVKNDERTKDGILRGADTTLITLTYTINGEEKTIEKEIKFVKKDENKLFTEEKVKFTTGTKASLRW